MARKPARNEVRISPNGDRLAWYRPDGDRFRPWLVIDEDPAMLGVETQWHPDAYVHGWTPLLPGADMDRVHTDLDLAVAEAEDARNGGMELVTELAEAQRSARHWKALAEQWEREHNNTVLPYTTKLEDALDRGHAMLAGLLGKWINGERGHPGYEARRPRWMAETELDSRSREVAAWRVSWQMPINCTPTTSPAPHADPHVPQRE